MSDLDKNEMPVAKEKTELPLEKKVELHSMENQAESQEDEAELQRILKNKNDILNEKKRAQMELKKYKEELESMKAMLQRQEQEKLEEKQEYKTLYERAQEELAKEKEARNQMQTNLINGQKKKAFDKELGKSLSKDRYYDFVNLNDIIIEDDGTINPDSVRYAVNLFRENYKELVPVTNVPRVGSEAPSNDGVLRPKQNINQMSAADRSELKRRRLLGS